MPHELRSVFMLLVSERLISRNAITNESIIGSVHYHQEHELYYMLKGKTTYYIGDEIWHSACCPHKGALLPAGDAHIVYPGTDGPWRSLRFEAQRAGAEDYELLVQALEIAPEQTEEIIRSVCTDFRSYTRNGSDIISARSKLIHLLEEVKSHG